MNHASAFPAFAPQTARWRALPVFGAVVLAHAAVALGAQFATRGDRPLAMPVDPAAPVMVLILPQDAAGAGAGQGGGGGPAVTAAATSLLAAVPQEKNLAKVEIGTGVPDSRYVAASALDIGPVPAGAPDFVSATRHTVPMGSVMLRVYVSTFGFPDRVEILGLPLDGDFARALRRALEQTTFQPGRMGGHDVAAFVDYEFQTQQLVVLPAPAEHRNS